jgi:hypothetical protein
MKMLFSMLILFLVILTVLLCVGSGIGFLLHWVLPSVDMGVAILIGVVTSGISIRFISGLMSRIPEEGYEIEDEDRESGRIYLIEPPSLRRRRRRRKVSRQ